MATYRDLYKKAQAKRKKVKLKSKKSFKKTTPKKVVKQEEE